MWSKEEHLKTVQGDQERTWNNLVTALGLPTKLALPYLLESSKTFSDVIYQGKKLEVVWPHGTVEPATLLLWRPQERRLTITLHLSDAPKFESYRHYEFCIYPSTKTGHSEIRLVLSLSLGMFQRMINSSIGGRPNLAQMVLKTIVDRFPRDKEDTTSSKR